MSQILPLLVYLAKLRAKLLCTNTLWSKLHCRAYYFRIGIIRYRYLISAAPVSSIIRRAAGVVAVLA